jgi:hypothetical protein
MYAVVGVWEMEKGRELEQKESLERDVMPLARTMLGFVGGYWALDVDDAGRSYSMILLDSEHAAREAGSMVQGNPLSREQGGVRPVSLVLAEVVAHADSPAPTAPPIES